MAIAFCGKRVLRPHTLFNTPVRTSYVVLVPEIGEDLPDKNPLLHPNGLLEFSDLTIEKCVAAIAKQTIDFENVIRQIEESLKTTPPSNVFQSVINPIESAGISLDTTWGIAKTLYLGNQGLMPTKSYMTIHDRARRARSTKFNSKLIYTACKAELESGNDLTEEQLRVINKFILEGKLNGLDLNEGQRFKFIEHIQKLNKERNSFKGKLTIATKQFSQVIREYEVVREFPEDLLKQTAADSTQPLEGPWKITLQPNIYNSFMEHCPDRELRWNLWQANVRRASGFADKSIQTSAHLEEIRFLRTQIAKILGYNNYVEMSMETKMVGSADVLKQTLNNLLEHAKPVQEEEFKNLQEFAGEQKLQHWDIPFWKRRQRKALYDFDEDKIREFFPLPAVLSGLFKLTENLFGIQIKERKVSTWHPDVKYYDIIESGEQVAGFYLDPYSRAEMKLRSTEDQGYAIGIRNKSKIGDVNPISALIFNFQRPPTKEVPSLLSFNEVQNLFTKFGHALQHLLTKAGYSEVSGFNNIEWDAVDISGHVLSHWLQDRNTMKSISSHYASSQPLPSNIINNLIKMKSHFAANELCHELYLANLDLALYSSKTFWLDVVKELYPQYHVLPLDKRDSHVCSFSSIFSDEWGAAYYSKVWSRLVAADVYSAFQEVKNDEKETALVGKRFKDTFLALGGASHPSTVFRRFRGRDPCPKALIQNLGLEKVSNAVDEDVEVVT